MVALTVLFWDSVRQVSSAPVPSSWLPTGRYWLLGAKSERKAKKFLGVLLLFVMVLFTCKG